MNFFRKKKDPKETKHSSEENKEGIPIVQSMSAKDYEIL